MKIRTTVAAAAAATTIVGAGAFVLPAIEIGRAHV